MPAPKKLCLNISVLCTAALIIACAGRSGAVDTIDAVTASPDKFKVLLDNEQVRVIEYKLRPGEKDNWHTHPAKSSYVVSGGNLKIRSENGEAIDVEEKTGTASWMNELGKHYAENVGKTDIVIVLTEVKAAH